MKIGTLLCTMEFKHMEVQFFIKGKLDCKLHCYPKIFKNGLSLVGIPTMATLFDLSWWQQTSSSGHIFGV